MVIEHLDQIRHVYLRPANHEVTEGQTPRVKVKFRVIRRYKVDSEGVKLPASEAKLYQTTRKKVGESKAKSVEEFYQFDYCLKCDEVKPPRTHHCSICNRCILKMDHHCPFIGNCIGLGNQKAFWLFCFYASLTLIQLCLTTYFYCKDI